MCVGCAIDCERADRKARPLPGQQRPATARMIPAWCGRHAVEKTARPAPAGGALSRRTECAVGRWPGAGRCVQLEAKLDGKKVILSFAD
jgi:hypothetical protein